MLQVAQKQKKQILINNSSIFDNICYNKEYTNCVFISDISGSGIKKINGKKYISSNKEFKLEEPCEI